MSQNITIPAVVISLIVAITTAVDGFFQYGERWRLYRRTSEQLKAEGWQFFQSIGDYQDMTHAVAYPVFATRVEEILQQDLEVFMKKKIAVEKKDQESSQSDAARDSDVPRSSPLSDAQAR